MARRGPSLLQRGDGNPNTVSGGFALGACCLAAIAGAALGLAAAAVARRRRSRAARYDDAPDDVELDAVELDDLASGDGLALAGDGVRPDLARVVARADEQLGAEAVVLAGGPPALLDALEDLCGGREVERMTWSM